MKIFHIVDMCEVRDAKTAERIWKCEQTWDPLLESGEIIPCYFYENMYPRNARDVLGDKRALPFLRDLFSFGMRQCKSDDILFFSNSDNILHSELPNYLKFHLSVHGPCSIFRTELRHGMPSLKLSPENFARTSTEKHVGRDGFAMSKAWLEENWDQVPDAVLACKMWDVHLAIVIRNYYGIVTSNSNIWEQMLPAEIPAGYTAHLAHQSAWAVNENASAGNNHNGKLFLEFAAKHCPNLKVTKEGNLA